MKLLKYVMKVFYANENFASYRIKGGNYLMSLIGGTFYLLMTLFLFLIIIFVAFPNFYRFYLALNEKINFKSFAAVILIVGFVIIKMIVKEDDLRDDAFTKEVTNRAVNYLIAYIMFVAFAIVIIGLEFLREAKV